MTENKNEAQILELNELMINDVPQRVNHKIIDQYLSKIKSLDVAQVKIYMGIAYFLLVSLLSITLFF